MVNTMDTSDLWGPGAPLHGAGAGGSPDGLAESPQILPRDSLHEADMSVVGGHHPPLSHQGPRRAALHLSPVLRVNVARMDLVGNDVPQVDDFKFSVPQKDGHARSFDYLRRTPSVRDVVVSGGDIPNLHITQLEPFVDALLDIPNIRDIRLASKGLIGLPQHFLQDDVLRGMERLAKKAFERGVDLALHCHANHAEQITPLVGRAVHRLQAMRTVMSSTGSVTCICSAVSNRQVCGNCSAARRRGDRRRR